MEFWIERILHSNNWVQILFFLFLSIILSLKLIDPIKFSFFIKFLNFKQYIIMDIILEILIFSTCFIF